MIISFVNTLALSTKYLSKCFLSKEIAQLKTLLRRERLKFRQYRYRVALKIKKLQQRYASQN